MSIPYFYIKQDCQVGQEIILPEETSKHMIQVLRMEAGESISLTNGDGGYGEAVITDPHKKKCRVEVKGYSYIHRDPLNVCIAISPLKNASRFEWFLEKATEIGINEIIPLLCTRTEKHHLRMDRMQGILVSAMLQSQQIWLPVLREPVRFSEAISHQTMENKWIAHCNEKEERSELADLDSRGNSIILIGPEGDFTSEEVDQALGKGFKPVSLGHTRLRTETAGIAAAVMLRMMSNR